MQAAWGVIVAKLVYWYARTCCTALSLCVFTAVQPCRHDVALRRRLAALVVSLGVSLALHLEDLSGGAIVLVNHPRITKK